MTPPVFARDWKRAGLVTVYSLPFGNLAAHAVTRAGPL